MASIAAAVAASTPMAVAAVGAAANLVASNKPLAAKTWTRTGGFIGLTNGATATVDTPSPAATPSAPPSRGVPIGGATDEPAPPTPFGRFRKCKPTKLPGPPKPYDPKDSP